MQFECAGMKSLIVITVSHPCQQEASSSDKSSISCQGFSRECYQTRFSRFFCLKAKGSHKTSRKHTQAIMLYETPVRVDIYVPPLTNVEEFKRRNNELCWDIRESHDRFFPDRTFQMYTPGILHVFFEGKVLALEFMKRLSLDRVYDKLQLVESSELNVNFYIQGVIDRHGDASVLCRAEDLPPTYKKKLTSEPRGKKRKREVKDEDVRKGAKRYRKKRTSSQRPQEKGDALIRGIALKNHIQTIAPDRREDLSDTSE